MSTTSVTLWDRNRLYIRAYRTENGGFGFYGEDRSGNYPSGSSTYEYRLYVKPDDVHRVTAALGGVSDSEVIDLLAEQGENIVKEGESTWLSRHDVPYEFSSWTSFSD